MSGVGDVFDAQQLEERRRAVRALLRRPLLVADGPDGDALPSIRKHASWLQELFAEYAGWHLHVERELVRLRKTPADLSDGSRPARARQDDPPFTRRQYVLLCLALAALERADRQITLRRVADGVAELVAADPSLDAAGIEFTLEGRQQRRDIVAVVRWLIGHGVLRRVQGEEEAFVADRGDVLYQVERGVLAQVLDVRQPPSLVATTHHEGRLEAISAEPRLQGEEARRRELRHRMVRRLLEDPVVYVDDMTEEDLDYFQRSRAVILDRLEKATGLVPELRREGVAMVDADGDLTDLSLPEEGTTGHVTLLIAEHLAEQARATAERPVTVTIAELEAAVRDLTAEYGQYWRKAAREPGAERELVRQAVEYLAGLRLVCVTERGVVPLAAIGRYGLVAASVGEGDQ